MAAFTARVLCGIALLLSTMTEAAPVTTPSLDSTTWSKYIIAPKSRVIGPVKLVNATGSVDNEYGLVSGSTTTLTRTSKSDTVPSITLDFGVNTVGFPRIVFSKASSNGPGVRVAFSESLEFLTDRSDFTRSDNADGRTHGTDNYRVPAGRTVWDLRLGCLYDDNKVCADGLHGFRYMKIMLDALDTDAPYTEPLGSFTIESVQLNVTGVLGTADTYGGWFECSDESINKYWYQGSYTTEMGIDTFRANDTEPRNASSPTLEGKLVTHDGAKRDRDPYVGDIAVSGRTIYLTHPDSSLAVRNVLADLADHQNKTSGWIPPASIVNYTLPLFDYSLWWVSTSYDYVMYTGDIGYLKQYWPTLDKVLNVWYASKTIANGLLSKGTDTGTNGYGDYAFLGRNGTVTYYNALYVRALKEAAQLARALGKDDQADKWQDLADDTASVLDDNNWDDVSGAYLDSPSNSRTRHAQDGNGMAVIAGVASKRRAITALTYMDKATKLPYGNSFMDDNTLVDDGKDRVYAFISYFDLEARFISGLVDSAFDQIRRLYGWMDTHDPASTHWEGIGKDGSKYEGGFTSLAHGWSTGIVPLMSNRVLGAIPTGPGFSTWTIKPTAGDLTWAKGVVPTPHGPLRISWSKYGDTFGIVVDAPKGTRGKVYVPTKSTDKTFRGFAVQDGYIVIENVQDGTHVYSNI